MSVELEKEKEDTHKPMKNNKEFSVSEDFASTSIIALLVALVALLFTYTFSLYLILFVEDYPYNNKNMLLKKTFGCLFSTYPQRRS